MRDHGGNIDMAMAQFGGAVDDWIDLSTGINRVPYPVPKVRQSAWTDLPTKASIGSLIAAAHKAYVSDAPIAPVAGAQAAIQLIPRAFGQGTARVVAPTYNEHAAAFRSAGWRVEEVGTIDALGGADIAVVVNPNNPDGQRFDSEQLLNLIPRVGVLVVDESFADADSSQSLASKCPREGLIVLRSFGKFYGLAGVRLGFVLGVERDVARIAEMAGPWPVTGAAIEIGRTALLDRDWWRATSERLAKDSARLDELARAAGWQLAGGCELFRLYETGNAVSAQDRLARSRIWSRVFPYSDGWLRLGLPGNEAEWRRLSTALE